MHYWASFLPEKPSLGKWEKFGWKNEGLHKILSQPYLFLSIGRLTKLKVKSWKILLPPSSKLKDKLWICENPFFYFVVEILKIRERKVSFIKSCNKNYTLINMKEKKNIILRIIAFKHEMKTLSSFKNVKKTILRNNRNDKKGWRRGKEKLK